MQSPAGSCSCSRSALRLLLAAVGVLLLAAGRTGAEPAQEKVFRFAPPEGTQCVLQTRRAETQSVGGTTIRKDVSEAKDRFNVAKSADGYTLTYEPISFNSTRNGAPFADPVLATLQESRLSLDVGADGRVRAVRGITEAFARLKEQLAQGGPSPVLRILPSIEKDATASVKADWNGKVAVLVGRSARVGATWKGADTIGTPFGGVIPVSATARILRVEKRGDRECVRVAYSFRSAGPGLRQEVARWVGRSLKGPSGRAAGAPKVVAAEAVGGGERLVDPDTMLFYSDTFGYTLKVTLNIPGGGQVQVTGKERREERYDYSAGTGEQPAGQQTQSSPLESGGGKE